MGSIYKNGKLFGGNPTIEAIGVGGGYAPIGTIIAYMGTTAPQDYLICDGSTYNITNYRQLARFIETQFGSINYFGGDGTTTFAVPDLRGEFLRGSGTNSHSGNGNGATVGSHQNGTKLPYHFMGVGSGVGTKYDLMRYDDRFLTSDKNYTYPALDHDGYTEGTNKKKLSFTTTNSPVEETNTAGAFGIRPTNTSVLYCIKAVCAGDVYSAEERIVGTWIDGKPIYQKTIQTNMPTTTTSTNYAHNISSIDQIISIDGGAWNGTTLLPVNLSPTTSGGQLRVSADKTNITVQFGTAPSNTYNGYWTVKYTKTTD